ncbi:hypothetical protein INR49_013755 [Caranx melampygus]|nr:hypothetical protein INR49_013755 [Caranx melampygus]
MEDPDIRQQKLENQRALLMKKQQKKRADSQMVTVNRDTRQKNRKHKTARSDETPLLISQSLSNTSLTDQVEHAHDNPLDEITLGECDMMVEEKLPEKPATPKKMNLDIDKEPEVKFSSGDNDAHLEGKKMKKKDGKKTKPNGEQNKEKEKKKEKDKEKKEKKTKKDKEKESEDTQKTNKTTKEELQKTDLQETSSQEKESAMEMESPKKSKYDENDDREEDRSKRAVPQSPKRKKQLDTTRCQISEESKDEKVQEKENKGKRTKQNKEEKTTPSLASLNSNYRESSSSGSESNERSTSPVSLEDLEKFALRPAPRDITIQCRVTRDRRGMEKGIYPTYYLHMEKEDGNRVFLMAGRKRKKCKTSNYLISTDATNLSRDTNSYIGKLRSNVLGTKFTVYDGGENPRKSPSSKNANQCGKSWQQYAMKMTVIIPGMMENDERVSIRPKNDLETLLVRHANGNTDKLVTLLNKSPSWNDQTQSYVLNFHGRVTQASVKNFQIIHPDNDDYIVMQFGRVAEDVFSMDYTFPLCALQAFAITLSSFDGKLACE